MLGLTRRDVKIVVGLALFFGLVTPGALSVKVGGLVGSLVVFLVIAVLTRFVTNRAIGG